MARDASSLSGVVGLTEAEALKRLLAEGFNDLPRTDRRTLLRIVGDVLREPMFALLLGAGVIYLVLGDLTEALVLLLFATISISITVAQETRSERVLEALRDMTSPRALVIRNGVRKRVPGREIVRGDAVVLLEGDRIAADAALAVANNLLVDESLLTGESVPVRKSAGDDCQRTPMARPGGEDQPFVYSGTLVVRGDGVAIVRATGPRSEIGKIGQALEKIATEPPRLQQQTRRLVRYFAVVGMTSSLIAVLLYGLLRGDWLQAILGGIALGMSMLPEEFPLVLTAFMVMGAWRLSQARVLTRRSAAIEMLGAATVLCTDKTGTLTENRMAVARLRTPASFDDQVRLVETALLASGRESFDPMELAIKAQAETQPGGGQRVYAGLELIRQYGLRPGVLAMTNVWRPRQEATMLACAKGAPETIAALCRLDIGRLAWLHGAVDEMAREGTRVLGVARAVHPGGVLPEVQQDFEFEFVGLVGLTDPMRVNVPAAVGECRSAGVRVVMITGDYPATAEAIAGRAGLERSAAMSGEELARLDEIALANRIGTVNIFARIMPEQKLRLVEALKAKGEIVAMTGDGVNDAPALKSAHIGIAMGGRGTDVAREASSIVLLDDDFGSIVRTIRLGRRIYDNLRKAMAYIVAVHIPIAGLALLPLLFGFPLVLTPIHIAFLEMVIDPACSIVFEAEPDEDDLMRRPPRSPASRILSGGLIGWSLVQGVLAFAVVAATFAGGLVREMPENELRALVFVSLVLINTSLILVNRSFSSSMLSAIVRPNLSLWVLLFGVCAILFVSLTWPPAMDLFRFGPLHLDDLSVSVLAGLAVLVILELIKPHWRRAFRA
ncbi:MAG: cation-translocating P-type ATPase [Burkholderiaceae bacterium]|nr:cation-translocating P-type ATPase [Burkholderiaceae bacterium]